MERNKQSDRSNDRLKIIALILFSFLVGLFVIITVSLIVESVYEKPEQIETKLSDIHTDLINAIECDDIFVDCIYSCNYVETVNDSILCVDNCSLLKSICRDGYNLSKTDPTPYEQIELMQKLQKNIDEQNKLISEYYDDNRTFSEIFDERADYIQNQTIEVE